jgi:KaiC/GvpD/RAD55 family RecA-like ATPase
VPYSPPRKPNGADPLSLSQQTEKPRLALVWFASIDGVIALEFLVHDLLLASSLFVIYGESNSGKTFFILDLALAIAAGSTWRDRRVRKGLVIYIASEGASSVRNRVAAFRKVRSEIAAGLPFAIIPEAVNLMDEVAANKLIATIRDAETESGEKVALVIFDTLARSLIGGDENSSQDMGIAVSMADRIRNETGSAVCFIHHSGKDASKGARGSNALRCAVDTEILVEGLNGPRTATVVKQRDLPSGQVYTFELEPVVIGESEDDPITSCVVRTSNASPTPQRKQPTGKNIAPAWEVLQKVEGEVITLGDIRKLLTTAIPNRNRRDEAIQWLQKNGWLTQTIGGVRIER